MSSSVGSDETPEEQPPPPPVDDGALVTGFELKLSPSWKFPYQQAEEEAARKKSKGLFSFMRRGEKKSTSKKQQETRQEKSKSIAPQGRSQQREPVEKKAPREDAREGFHMDDNSLIDKMSEDEDEMLDDTMMDKEVTFFLENKDSSTSETTGVLAPEEDSSDGNSDNAPIKSIAIEKDDVVDGFGLDLVNGIAWEIKESLYPTPPPRPTEPVTLFTCGMPKPKQVNCGPQLLGWNEASRRSVFLQESDHCVCIYE